MDTEERESLLDMVGLVLAHSRHEHEAEDAVLEHIDLKSLIWTMTDYIYCVLRMESAMTAAGVAVQGYPMPTPEQDAAYVTAWADRWRRRALRQDES